MRSGAPSSWAQTAAKEVLLSRRMLIWLAVMTVVGIVLLLIPLFNVLGYEFSLVMALVGSIAGIDIGAALVRRLRKVRVTPLARNVAPGRLCADLIVRSAGLSTVALMPPLLLIVIGGLWVRNCDYVFGLSCFLFISVLSTALASIVGVLCALSLVEHKKLALVLPFAILVFSIGRSVYQFYAAPPVFSFNMFAGYFPGNVYDENIMLGSAFVWSRLYQVLLMAALACLAAVLLDVPAARLQWRRDRRPTGSRWRSIALTATALVAAFWIRQSGGELGFAVDEDDIIAELSGRHETEHFTIHYPRGGDIERDIELIAQDHEFRLAQVVKTLGIEPSARYTSFYFQNAEQKFRLMGARNVYMAKPWRNEIYLHHRRFPHQILRHEIAHLVAGEFGDPVFHVSAKTVLGLPLMFRVGLIEGVAVAADWPDHFTRPLTPHQSVKALTDLDMAPRLSSLFSTGFLASAPARSYTVAGSFMRYLIDNYGAERFRIFYRTGGDFDEAYGVSLAELEAGWREMIDATVLPEGAAEVIRERFRRRSIFRRPCPHAIARKRSRAADLLGEGDTAGAIELLREICDDIPDEPRYKMDLARVLLRADHDDEAAVIYQAIADDDERVSSTLRARSLLALANRAAADKDMTQARTLLSRAATLPVDDNLARNVVARRHAATSKWPDAAGLRAYFFDHPPRGPLDTVVQVARAATALADDPESAMAHYLIGRNVTQHGAPADAVAYLSEAIDLGLPHPLLRREAAKLLAESAYMAGDEENLRRAAWILQETEQPEVMRLYGADWLERLEWAKKQSVWKPAPAEP